MLNMILEKWMNRCLLLAVCLTKLIKGVARLKPRNSKTLEFLDGMIKII